MLTFYDLLHTVDIDPSLVTLVRHSNKEVPILDLFENDPARFIEYNAWQKPGRYRASGFVAVFGPARGTSAQFLTLLSIDGATPNEKLNRTHRQLLRKYALPETWLDSAERYDLSFMAELSDLSKRLIVDWGGSTVSWFQKKDKPVVQIKGRNSVGDFFSFDNVQLSYFELKSLLTDTETNFVWVNALSSVNGVYLIRDSSDGRFYVGSAYGKSGIWGRWGAYAKNGHGGNKHLKPLDHSKLEFSILEIAPSNMSAEDVIARENRWKVRLGTRDFGLNDN